MVTLILTLNIQDKIYLCLQKRKDEEGAMDDSTLIEQIQLGSKDAFKQMFIKFYSPLCEYASQYVSDEDAEELIQELMLFIWENRNSLFVEISLKSYLFMAVKRVHSLIYDKIKDQFENPDTYFVNELTENITKAIEELPENYRETFKLSRFGEQSNLQIAEALGVSIKTVEYRITQSLKILRVKLKDYLPFIMFLF